jgi:membrane protein YdbS with pleckstrin-like domain
MATTSLARPDMPVEELLAHRPRSHVDGIFPNRYLGPNEMILYSTRPSFIGIVIPATAGAAIGFAIAEFSLWFTQTQFGYPPVVYQIFSILVLLVAVAGTLGALYAWYYSCYAITNSRILVKHGGFLRVIIEIPNGAIQSVMFTESGLGRNFDFGTLQFSSASVAGYALTPSGSRPGVVNWRAAPHPLETRAFVELVQRTEFI